MTSIGFLFLAARLQAIAAQCYWPEKFPGAKFRLEYRLALNVMLAVRMRQLWLLANLLLATLPASAAETSSRYELRSQHDPNGIGKFYMGREIAYVMGHEAANWLERREREAQSNME